MRLLSLVSACQVTLLVAFTRLDSGVPSCGMTEDVRSPSVPGETWPCISALISRRISSMMLRRSAAKLRSVSGLCWGLSLLAALVRVLRRRERGESRSESLPLELRGETDRGGRCLLNVSGPELLRACLSRAVCDLPPTSVARVPM